MTPAADLPDWAIAEKAAHAAEHAATLRRIAIDAQWERMWTAYVKAARYDNAFTRRYMDILEAGMARLDAERERERA